ncbi:hypothetical protein J1N35_045095 [Gossypium stocksii]|uniref:Retrovirus-related Pol polyprotein from transposon TNT 1-94 n=1 Tax=Gossypium stocksii TaxID=47602 RepID=A0A9D3UAB9_9ROSI|nr:hypothetical protein J1N35_045095 [Gossypium stocksii]
MSKVYWQVVSEGIEEPTNGTIVTEAQKKEIERLRLKDLKAKNYLFQAIDHSNLETILCKDTSKNIWDSMKKKYHDSARARRQQLQALHSEFETLRMKSSESKFFQQEKEEHAFKASIDNHFTTRGDRGRGKGRGKCGGNNDHGDHPYHHH